MPLTKWQQSVIDECAVLIGLNGGLSYQGLARDVASNILLNGTESALDNVQHVICYVGKNYGLNGASYGRIVQTAVSRGDTNMQIVIPTPVKIELTESERLVLEHTAKVLVPEWGNFSRYTHRVRESTGLRATTVTRTLETITQKFNAANIEQAVVSAFASGLLNPHILFGTEIPQSLAAIMSSDAYRKVSQYQIAGVHGRRISKEEEDIARDLIKRMGVNGGLYWGRNDWLSESARATGRSLPAVKGALQSMSRKLGISRKGLLLFKVAELLRENVEVKVPAIRMVDFDDVEYQVIEASAKTLLHAGGYYQGYIIKTSSELHFFHIYVNRINHRIVEKTNTNNLGQAVTYFLAHKLIPVPSLKLDPQRTPALEAIIAATANIRSAAS